MEVVKYEVKEEVKDENMDQDTEEEKFLVDSITTNNEFHVEEETLTIIWVGLLGLCFEVGEEGKLPYLSKIRQSYARNLKFGM